MLYYMAERSLRAAATAVLAKYAKVKIIFDRFFFFSASNGSVQHNKGAFSKN